MLIRENMKKRGKIKPKERCRETRTMATGGQVKKEEEKVDYKR